jgi:hypothetical protein
MQPIYMQMSLNNGGTLWDPSIRFYHLTKFLLRLSAFMARSLTRLFVYSLTYLLGIQDRPEEVVFNIYRDLLCYSYFSFNSLLLPVSWLLNWELCYCVCMYIIVHIIMEILTHLLTLLTSIQMSEGAFRKSTKKTYLFLLCWASFHPAFT